MSDNTESYCETVGNAFKTLRYQRCTFGLEELHINGAIVDTTPICLLHGDELQVIEDFPQKGQDALYCMDRYDYWPIDQQIDDYGTPEDYEDLIDNFGEHMPPSFILAVTADLLKADYRIDQQQYLQATRLLSLALERKDVPDPIEGKGVYQK